MNEFLENLYLEFLIYYELDFFKTGNDNFSQIIIFHYSDTSPIRAN